LRATDKSSERCSAWYVKPKPPCPSGRSITYSIRNAQRIQRAKMVIAYNELRRDVTCRLALLCCKTRAERTRLTLAAHCKRAAPHPDPVVEAFAAFISAGAAPVVLAPDQEVATVKSVANRSHFVEQERRADEIGEQVSFAGLSAYEAMCGLWGGSRVCYLTIAARQQPPRPAIQFSFEGIAEADLAPVIHLAQAVGW
jgi:hypothetical protein